METQMVSREHSLSRIVDDTGRAFSVGAIGGSVFHFVKATYNSPNGSRFLGGTQAVRMNAPRLGGSFAAYGGLFSAFDYAMVQMRKKEDPWNSIVAGAATGGFLSMRQGLRAALGNAVFGGVLLALITGNRLAANKFATCRLMSCDCIILHTAAAEAAPRVDPLQAAETPVDEMMRHVYVDPNDPTKIYLQQPSGESQLRRRAYHSSAADH